MPWALGAGGNFDQRSNIRTGFVLAPCLSICCLSVSISLSLSFYWLSSASPWPGITGKVIFLFHVTALTTCQGVGEGGG